jgi:hypothetical protein
MTVENQADSIICRPNRPSGLGFTPDGRLLIISMVTLLILNGNLGLKECRPQSLVPG